MKIYDFDEKFAEYARRWIALHPGLKPEQVEESYNEIMRAWLNAPATWLGGATPGSYFERYDDPKDLMKLLEEYDKRDMDLPEPLYARIVSLEEACVPRLMQTVQNRDRSDALRASALAMLRDIGSPTPRELYVDLIANARDDDFEIELCEMALEALKDLYDPAVVDELLARYEGAISHAQLVILDLCAKFPRDERVLNLCLKRLREDPDSREMIAALLGEIGDPSAIGSLREMLESAELSYGAYLEIRNAIEMLGEDAGPERDFTGDPDYEALRNS